MFYLWIDFVSLLEEDTYHENTEWDIYSEVNWGEVSKKMRSPSWVFDTRLIVDEEKVINSGLSFWRVGVGTIKGVWIFSEN